MKKFFQKQSAYSFKKPNCLDGIQLNSTLQKKATCKGIALIVSNNYEGTDKRLPSTDRDSDEMKTFFETLGNYEVVVPKKNLTVGEFKYICEHLASLPYPEIYRRVVIYIAGHGGDGFIEFRDKEVHIEDIQAIFDPNKHAKLYNMARIFFIDACRGSSRYSSHARGGSGTQKAYSPHCKYDNELIAYSTLKGYVASDDDKEGGGLWTHELYTCLVLEEYMHEDLSHVLVFVNKRLGTRQTSTYHSTLSTSGLIYFWKEAGILESDYIKATTEDIGDNEEAHETAVSETATAHPSSEKLHLEEQKDGSSGDTANLTIEKLQLEVEKDGSGGGDNEANLEQCTEQTGESSAAQLTPLNAPTVPVQQSEQTSITQQSYVTQSTENIVHLSEAAQSDGSASNLVLNGSATSTVTGVAAPEEQRAKAYIVYQNEGNLSDRVLNFANFLRMHCGVNCDTTSYHLDKHVTNWNEYIKDRIEKAEYILLVCTRKLNEKLIGQSHSRVEMTKSTGPYILSSTLNSLIETNPKTLPIILEEGSRKYIPSHLQSTTIYTISFDALSTVEHIDKQAAKKLLDEPKYKDLRSLAAKLLRQLEIMKPVVAQTPPNLTRKPRQW